MIFKIGSSVKPAIAHDTGHDPIDVLVRPFFLTVSGKRQLVAENLHAAEISYSGSHEVTFLRASDCLVDKEVVHEMGHHLVTALLPGGVRPETE